MSGRAVPLRDVARATWGIAGRSLLLIPRVPSTFVPSLVMPVFLTIAFAGQFAGLVLLRGFPADKAIDWFVPMTAVQGAAFAGVTTGMGLARDLEIGFYSRLLLTPSSRAALLGGPLVAAVLRSFLPLTLLLAVAVLGDANFHGGPMAVVTLAVACWGIALVAGAWSAALALRLRSQQAAPLMQTGVFLAVFLSTAQMPLELLSGWLHHVARFNPMTNVLRLARQGFLGDVTWAATWPGLLSILGMSVVLVAFAGRALGRINDR